jgi:cytochrome c oxidase cbb3-type subunit III
MVRLTMNAPAAAPLAVMLALSAPMLSAQEPAPQDLYRAKCQQCHMANGNSPLAPMNFADGKWAHGSKPEEVEKVIAEGVPGTAMLSFKKQFSPEQIAALAEYVRSFDKSLKPAKKK